jgi:hypothetical protein
MNEAALLAARRRRKDISKREVEEAVERTVAGPERKSKVIGPKEKKVLAYHELGHALVAKFTPDADPVAKVSIIPRGKGALGYTLTLPSEDRYIITREQLLARIRDDPRRAHRGRDRLQPPFDRRRGRPAEGHPPRAGHRLPLRHDRRTRPRGLRHQL